jgi:predicted HTH domain antitoxin
MKTKAVAVPEDVLALLRKSKLAGRSEADQVRAILAIHLFQEHLISIGKAAELAGENRSDFELMMVNLGFPVVWYDEAELEKDLRSLDVAEERAKNR